MIDLFSRRVVGMVDAKPTDDRSRFESAPYGCLAQKAEERRVGSFRQGKLIH